jgi:hypothetical protein
MSQENLSKMFVIFGSIVIAVNRNIVTNFVKGLTIAK